MDNPITLGHLIMGVGLLIAILAMMVGLLMVFAGGMASAPTRESDETITKGCVTSIVGLAVAIGAVWAWFL